MNERITVTIDELVVERGADVEDAVRAALDGQPTDAARVADAVAKSVDAETRP